MGKLPSLAAGCLPASRYYSSSVHMQTFSSRTSSQQQLPGPGKDSTSTRAQQEPGNFNGQLKQNEPGAQVSVPAHQFSQTAVHAAPAGLIQPKLSVNQPGDVYEQEADRVAEQVVQQAATSPVSQAPAGIQRACAECEAEKKEEEGSPNQPTITPVTSAAHAAPAFQNIEGQDDEYPPATQGVIFRKATFSSPVAAVQPTHGIAGRLAARESAGEPLHAGTRQQMEHAFGHNFSRVRIHRDAEAGSISRQLSAQAFTQGHHIYFGDNKYDPAAASGKRLLAHELTHVVQQGQAAPKQGSAVKPAVPNRAGVPAIQRTATWGAAGVVHPTNSLSDAVLNGSAVGVTWPTLNGATFWSTAAARAALVKPTLTIVPAIGGGAGFTAKVNTVPDNTGSFDETVLSAGPWTTVTTKATIGARFPALAACTGAGNTTFRAIGDPSDAAMATANRRHEDHHAADHKAAFVGSVVPWDTRLAVAKAAGTQFNGATAAAAEAALHTAMGGTPESVADAFFNACQAAVIAFHGTAAGGPVGAPTGPTADATCANSSAKYTNPS